MKIKGKLMSFIIFIVVIPLAVMGISSYLKGANVLNENLIESNKALNKEIAAGIEKEFEGYINGVEAIAENIDAVGILDTPAYEPFLRGLFTLYVDNYPAAYQMYMGTLDGGMRIEPHFDFDSSYDPRARGWYILAETTGKRGYTDIYQDAVTGNIALSASVPVYNTENKFIGAVATSIDLSEVSKAIAEVRVGERGYVFILDHHGDVVAHPNSDLIGSNLAVPEIQEVLKSNPQSGLIDYEFEDSDGNVSDKYVVFDYMPDTRWYIMTSMYYDEIASSTSTLLYNALIIGIVTIIVALTIAFVFSNSIVKPIRVIVNDMALVESGDMRVQSNVNSKDEIGELANKFNSMVLNVRNLIDSAITVSHDVENASSVLASSSDRASESSAEVTRTIEEIAQGSTDQAHETESAARLTGSLDENFEKLYNNSKEIAENADNVKVINKEGLDVLMDLKGKSEQNSESTEKISDAILDLDLKSKDIGGIISTITSISEQTNLLALNASIEAARAGEHGRGFAVVADEIRKLAEESSKSADEISAIIEMIQAKTFETVEIMGEFKTNSSAQYEAVDKMDESFEEISNSIDGIVVQISDIDKFIKIMLNEKNEIVNAITNISSVSEETAAASEQVSATMDQQNEAVEEVSKSADKLSELSRNLSEQINKFKI